MSRSDLGAKRIREGFEVGVVFVRVRSTFGVSAALFRESTSLLIIVGRNL